MSEQIQKNKSHTSATDTTVDKADQGTSASTSSGDKLKADLDDLLDEIDDVLEVNAEDFVKSYVQKGGQ